MHLANYPLLLILAGSIVVLIGASELGRRFGLLAGQQRRENVSTLEGSILGLMAL